MLIWYLSYELAAVSHIGGWNSRLSLRRLFSVLLKPHIQSCIPDLLIFIDVLQYDVMREAVTHGVVPCQSTEFSMVNVV